MFAHAFFEYIFESTRDYAKYNGMIVLFQILGRLKSGTAKDRYVADKNCTLAILYAKSFKRGERNSVMLD